MKKKILRIINIGALLTLLFALILFNCGSADGRDGKDDIALRNNIKITYTMNKRNINSSSIPKDFVNSFPNNHNPNAPSNQNISVSMTLAPVMDVSNTAGSKTIEGKYIVAGLMAKKQSTSPPTRPLTKIGIAVNGVLLEPGTAEVWNPDVKKRGQVWQVDDVQWSYDGLGQSRTGDFVGMDTYMGHVQPTGLYHYHSITSKTGLYKDDGSLSPIVAFSADGHPIFGPYGYDERGKTIIKMYGNYRLINNGGKRESRNGQNPGGNYDGTFIQDYQFSAGEGDVDFIESGIQKSILDVANGHIGKVPADEMEAYNFSSDFLGEKDTSDDTYTLYHYHISANFPYVPRRFYGTPDDSFQKIDAREGLNDMKKPRRNF